MQNVTWHIHRILIVADDPQVVGRATSVARELEYPVETISSSLLFMKAFVRFKPDIVVLDFMMPDIGGLEVLQWLIDVDYTGRLVALSEDDRYPAMMTAVTSAKSRMKVTALRGSFTTTDFQLALDGGAMQATRNSGLVAAL